MLKGFGVPLPVDHVIFRAPNDTKGSWKLSIWLTTVELPLSGIVGREWLSSIELVIRHSPDYFTQPNQSGLKEGIRRTVSGGPDGRTLLDRSLSETCAPRSLDTVSNHPDGPNVDETDSQGNPN